MLRKCKVNCDSSHRKERPFIMQAVLGLLIPFVMIYGIYILFNGHLTPGGGFSGGTILGAGLVLCSIAYGPVKIRTFFTLKTFAVLCTASLGFYTIAKGYSFIMGAAGLSTGIPLGTPGNILSGGLILPLSISIGIVVACVVYSFFAIFSEGEV